MSDVVFEFENIDWTNDKTLNELMIDLSRSLCAAYVPYAIRSEKMMSHEGGVPRVFEIAFVSNDENNCLSKVREIAEIYGETYEENFRPFCQNARLPANTEIFCYNMNYHKDKDGNKFPHIFVVARVLIDR